MSEFLTAAGESLKANGDFIASDDDKALIDSTFLALEEAEARGDLPRHFDMSALDTILSDDQLGLVRRVFEIDPAAYGFKGPYVGIEPVPKELRRIEPQPFHINGKPAMTRLQEVPVPTFNAFSAMAEAMKKDIDRSLLIAGGYRTSAAQALLFLYYLQLYDYDTPQTARRVALPGFSEHGTPSSLALDLQNVDGLPSTENPTDFEDTQEYRWLLENANRFDFYQSYPKDNPQGVMFEPWHWRHIPAS